MVVTGIVPAKRNPVRPVTAITSIHATFRLRKLASDMQVSFATSNLEGNSAF
jgi:hypothetical protein